MLRVRRWILATSFSSVLVGLASPAHAEPAPRGEVELAAVTSTPLSGSDYADAFGQGLGLGLRGVRWLGGGDGWHGGLELAAQVSRSTYALPIDPFDATLDFDTYRYRGLLGVRVDVPFAARYGLVFRALGGVEHLRSEDLYFVVGGGAPQTIRYTDTAPAAELGAGLQVVVGAVRLGVEVALPLAFYGIDAPHHTVDLGGAQVVVADDLVHETTVDLDVRLTAGLRF